MDEHASRFLLTCVRLFPPPTEDYAFPVFEKPLKEGSMIVAFGNNQREIVLLILRAKRPYFIYHRHKEPVCRQRQVSSQCFHQPLLSELFSPAVK